MNVISPCLITPTVQARFWAKVEQRGPDECWLWTGCKSIKDRRGKFWLAGKLVSAPRVAFVCYSQSKIETNDYVCHSCDNPPCVNPSHLWLGTAAQNNIDASSKGRLYNQNLSHCRNGHEFTLSNTLIVTRRNGNMRQCRQCNTAAVARYRAQKRAQP